MTQTVEPVSPASIDGPSSFERTCLNGALLLSALGIVAAIVMWWVVRFANVTAAEEGGRVRDLANVNWGTGPLPFVLFVAFTVGLIAAALTFIGANAARSAPWKAALAGMMSAAILMVPVVTVANALVTAGIWNAITGD